MANPYAKAPLYAAQVDPTTGRHVRAVFFLGAVPRAVLEAARRGRASAADPRQPEWGAPDAATLRAHYGPHWRDLLTAEDPPPPEPLGVGASSRAVSFFSGGAPEVELSGAPEAEPSGEPEAEPSGGLWAEPSGGLWAEPSGGLWAEPSGGAPEAEFGDLGEIDEIEAGVVAQPQARGRAQRAEGWPAPVEAGPPVYSDIAVYPEDTVHELRLKLGLASGVALYRQHLFYYVNEEGPVLPYRLTVDGAPVVAGWRALRREARGGPRVAGVPVDPRLEERREGIRVEALDTFTALGPAPNVRVTRAYYVDLYAVLPPLGAAERPQDDLAAALRDRYQFDLLYYGGLLRYWPQLSPDACSVALSAPGRVAAAYPALDPDPAELGARFAAERAAADAAAGWRPAAAGGARAAVAVTAATVRVPPVAARVRVAVRNVFDWVPTSLAVAASAARFDVDTALLAEAGAGAGPRSRLGGFAPVAAAKRHASSYSPQAARAVDWFVARAPPRDTVAFALAREAPGDERLVPGATGRRVPYAFLAVRADGRYEVAADWREDDRVGLERAAEELAAVAGPTVEAINAMGAVAFPLGGRLAPPPGRAGARPAGAALGALAVSVFWPHALSAAAFRELKARFRAYERAGLVSVRGLQQAGAYAFAFRKGVVAYDPRLADRATRTEPADEPGPRAGRGLGAANQYAWLADPAAAARWGAAFQGRAVRILHRATDLRVEIQGADDLAEFELIRRYVFAFLDGLLAGPGRLRPGGPGPALAPADEARGKAPSRRLRRLQERDPDLFDLKKHDQNATVYSVLCQSGRQPHVYDEAEARALGARRRAALVRYWNFTAREPAYYECPDPKYPHLSLRAGAHPLGFCLPCCKKTRPAAGSRAALVNEGCLQRRGLAPEPPGPAASRHVLTYGKAVPPGRLSGLPHELGEGLLLGALPAPYALHLTGVEQAAPAVPDAGYAYALAHAVGLGDASADEVLAELAGHAAGMGDTFYALGGGAGAAFSSAGDLADAILGAFVRRDDALSPFGPGGAAAAGWPAVLADLARHAFGVETVVAADPEGLGAVTLEASPETVATLAERPGGTRAAPRVALLVAGPMGTYPVVALDPRLYMRVAPARRWMTARRTFDAGAPAAGTVADAVVERLADALGAGAGPTGGLPDLAAVTGYAAQAGRALAQSPSFEIAARHVDLRGLCYGLLLRERTGNAARHAYFPVRRSPCPADGTPALYGARPATPLPADALGVLVAEFNEYAARAGVPVAPVAPAAPLADAEGRTVGFAHAAGPDALYFYHDPTGPAPGGAIQLPYDPREVDAAVLEAARAPPAPEPARAALAREARARNRLYRRFLAEFSALLRGDRDAETRRALADAIRATRFESPRSVGELRRRLAGLLRGHPDDLLAVQGAIGRAYVASPRDPAGAALESIAATTFAFDRQTLARLRGLESHDEVVMALREALAPRVLVAPAAAALARPEGPTPNLYASCLEAPEGAACEEGRLVVPDDRIDAYYDILAADVRNPGKAGLLAAVSAGIFDPLDFIRRPGEHLSFTVGDAR